jgi:hypothetical protein
MSFASARRRCRSVYAIDHDLAAQYFSQGFRAAVAYYPVCGVAIAPSMTASLLVLIGEADEWSEAYRCGCAAPGGRSQW